MEITRVTVDEVRERLARREPLTIVDARSAESWAKSETQIRVRSGCRQTTWPGTPNAFPAIAPSSRIAPDQASTRAPGWRMSSPSGASVTSMLCTAGSRHGYEPASRWNA
jgi:hypothetical protein